MDPHNPAVFMPPLFLLFVLLIIAIVQVRKYLCFRQEVELKRDLVERGLSIDEIERVVAAKSTVDSNRGSNFQRILPLPETSSQRNPMRFGRRAFMRALQIINVIVGVGFIYAGVYLGYDSIAHPGDLCWPMHDYPATGILLAIVFVMQGVLAFLLTPSQLFWGALLGPFALLKVDLRNETLDSLGASKSKDKSEGTDRTKA
jgi:hypothetical protein